MTKKIKIEFAPGAFDNFDGTQEELDELVAEITRMAESGEMLEKSQRVDIEELMEEDPEWAKAIIETLMRSDEEDPNKGRTLQ